MTENFFHFSPTRAVAVFSLSVLALLWAMYLRMGDELLDDGAFFLRYAVNAANGYFWVWNPGDPPVWGASAPFYPILVALPIKLGVEPVPAIIATGMILSCVSLGTVILLVIRHFGPLAGLAMLIFLMLDSNIMWMSFNGLESPLTLALLVAALWALLERPRDTVVGLIAGLIMINKLDLVPVGGLLLLAFWLRNRSFPVSAFAVAALVAGGWYGFAWWYFGAPVPNSFLTKTLHQNDLPKIIDWTWFGTALLWTGVHKWVLGLSLVALLIGNRAYRPLALFMSGSVIVHLVAYTIKYPFEPYNWYLIPSAFLLVLGGAIAIGFLHRFLHARMQRRSWVGAPIIAVILFVITGASLHEERSQTDWMVMFTTYQEYDRAEAGRWVDKNVPENFGVLTYWGNPAYFSERYVYDGSFLNRPFENVDMVSAYRPEILILQSAPGSSPTAPASLMLGPGPIPEDGPYRVLRVFDRTYQAGMDYYFMVLARADILDQLPAPVVPPNVEQYISDVDLGNTYGTVQNRGRFFFVHPGETTPTSFLFDVEGFAADRDACVLSLHARIAENIPPEAVARGGGVVRVRVLQGTQERLSALVNPNTELYRTLTCQDGEPLRFEVSSEGSPDADWLWISFR